MQRKRTARSALLVAILLILAATGSASDSPAGQEEAIRRGAAIHARACAACHGRDGGGDGPGAAELHPWPRDFTAGKYRIRSTTSGEAPRRADIEVGLSDGLNIEVVSGLDEGDRVVQRPPRDVLDEE